MESFTGCLVAELQPQFRSDFRWAEFETELGSATSGKGSRVPVAIRVEFGAEDLDRRRAFRKAKIGHVQHDKGEFHERRLDLINLYATSSFARR